jgi:TolB protein
MPKQKITTWATLLALAALLAASLLPAAASAAPVAGTGPGDAVAVTGDWQPLPPGDSHWYAFDYQGNGSQIQVRLEAVPEGSATFALWTPEGIRRWGLGLEAEPIGRGSTDLAAGTALVWSGSFTTPGTYCVAVEHQGNPAGTSNYQLEVSGDGVLDPGTKAAAEAAKTAAPAQTSPTTGAQPKLANSEPTGKLVFQTTIGGDFYTVNADGSNLQRITDGVDPVWSPGGEQIAFTRWRDPRGVWVVNADGTGERRVFDWSSARWPSWSPDGQEILFTHQKGGRENAVDRCFFGFCFTFPAKPHWKLGIVEPADGSFREPGGAQVSLSPDWSPDGERVVYDGEQGLVVQYLESNTSHQITHHGQDTGPVWSPDGEQVAFTRRQHDHWEVYVVDDDGQNPRRLTTTPKKPNGEVGNSAAPAWSPDGQHLAFLTDRTGKWEIWIMDANGANPRPMFDTALDGLPIEYSAVSERAISWTE